MTKPRKRKSATDRKAEIVETAIRLSVRLGPDRVTTQHLADEVGVTQPAIFRHFATKADIWLAVGDHIVNQMDVLHSHPVDLSDADAHGMLQTIIGQHFLQIQTHPAIPAILFSSELQNANETLRTKFSAVLAKRREEIAALISRAQSIGQHRAGIVAEDAAQIITAAMQGLSMRWLLDNQAFNIAEEGPRVLGSLIDSFRA